jgi:chemotaxis protein methyltransferase WspC
VSRTREPLTTPACSCVADARTLADEGRLADAAQRCEEHLRQHGLSADAFYVLGVVRDASGRHDDAGVCYRKALYLDPNHAEALAHLVLHTEQAGRPAEARVLRNRMSRLQQRA